MTDQSKTTNVVIYHNPACSTSRKVLGMIREAGIEPTIVEYLKAPPSRDELVALAGRLGLPLASILRKKAPAYAELGLGRDGVSDAAILAAIAAHPVLIERPIVVTDRGARLCRPPQLVHDVLPG